MYQLSLAGILGMFSCSESRQAGNKGPIVLGDPATIVTEPDSQYLRDMVMDYQPLRTVAPAVDTTQSPAPDTAAQPKPEEPAASNTAPAETENRPAEEPQGKGLKISLGPASLFIPGIEARGKGTTFQLTSGSLNGKEIKVSGARIQKIAQRYQTVVVAKNNLGTLVLDNLNTTTGWETLRGTSNTFSITGLNANRLSAPRVSPSSIRNAVSKAAKKKRMSRNAEQKWLNSVKNVRSANQRPLSVKLRSVMWKVDGKDSKGKTFSKQVRIDMPL